jgi:hypothetical protein
MNKLGPGIYDDEGELHVDLIELCSSWGWEPTEFNQRRAQAVVRNAIAEIFPFTKIEYTNDGRTWKGAR